MARKSLLLLVAAILAVGTVSQAASVPQVISQAKGFYLGHISLTDIRNDALDPTVRRDGAQAPEPAVLNMPVGPGDVIRTSKERRVELQFDNATIVRLDLDTELKIETIMAQGLSSANQMTNLVLARGRLFVMYKQYNNRELFQVLTPKTAVKFKHNAVGIVALGADGATDVQVQYGKAVALYGADLKAPKQLEIAAKERATFTPDNRFALGEPRPVDGFEAWNKAVNDDFEALHEGKSALPKPVQKLSPAVFYWAQRYGSRFGDWLYDDYFGYVWRPHYNDIYPWGTWRPFFAGSWSYYRNAMYWLPSEPWGWIPYHLGVWHWSGKRGWYWIPGSAFAPAWADWAFFGGYWSWRPWSLWDWGMWYSDSIGWMNGLGGMDGWNYWGWRYPWLGFGGPGGGYPGTGQPAQQILNTISKDQLKKPASPPFPMPKELRSGLKALMSDRRKGEPAARESFLAQGRFTSLADRAGLMAPDLRAKALPFESFPTVVKTPPAGQTWSSYYAAMAARPRVAEVPAGGGTGVAGYPSQLRSQAPAMASRAGGGSGLRTIDWNPDVRFAQKMGVQLRYVSGRNEIYCPELNLTSSNSRYSPENRRGSASSDGSYSGSGSSSGGTSGGGAASSGTSSGATSSGSATSSGTSSGSTGTTTGHVIKK